MTDPIILTERERAVFACISRTLAKGLTGDGIIVSNAILHFLNADFLARTESASPPRVPGVGMPMRHAGQWEELPNARKPTGVESGPGQPIDRIWLIYSREHNAFWGSNRCGYTRVIAHAGRYTEAEAFECCQQRDEQGDGSPSEIAVVAPEAAAEIRRLRAVVDECQEAAGIPADQAEDYFTVPALIADKFVEMEDRAKSERRAGIEAAAKWHDEKADFCARNFGDGDIGAKMIGEEHRDHACAIRALADEPAPDPLLAGLSHVREHLRTDGNAVRLIAWLDAEIAARKGG